MKRGDTFTAATGSGFGDKPRPVLIIQDNAFSELGTSLVVPLSSKVDDLIGFRPLIRPDASNGLRLPSAAMVDIMFGVRHDKFGSHIGKLSASDMADVETVLLLILGFTA